ncbi:conserved hypothetical protein [Frankia canadensis]|uniref:Uncharacterized protein n=1 Tax=Frankia canadensis TaxID=1836972 RepID=A0A2I2KZZ6_9ACTN|nr:hypothetical protein [Frankia canadensis]SNQ51236.1 conserved hypothetical protein [Frankia canadensis]SOU58526.1 conserved hypothetical protein [Frankia canadensis]
MLIDCDSCVARGARCAGCVVTVMFAGADRPGAAASPGWDAEEFRALGVLAAAGLLPPPGEMAGSVLERTARLLPPPRRAG